jgi:N-acyl homoserine lactone hydrolase
MEGLEFTLITTGVASGDMGGIYSGFNFATYDHKERGNGWFEGPVYCVLIKHPTAGYWMYDVGFGLGDDGERRPAAHRNVTHLEIKREEFVDKRLESLGLSVNDISGIIISHCHWDHFGGLMFFKGTKAIKNIWTCEADYAKGLVSSHANARGYAEPADYYYKDNFEVEGAQFHFIEEDTEFLPGLELLILEGHSPGVLAMVLHCEENTYIFPSDTINCAENYYDPITKPAGLYDSLGYIRSVKRVRKLQKEYNAKMIFPHDIFHFNEYHFAPYVYK